VGVIPVDIDECIEMTMHLKKTKLYIWQTSDTSGLGNYFFHFLLHIVNIHIRFGGDEQNILTKES